MLPGMRGEEAPDLLYPFAGKRCAGERGKESCQRTAEKRFEDPRKVAAKGKA